MRSTKSLGLKTILGITIAAGAATGAVAASPSFSDCFTLKPGLSYVMSGQLRIQIIKTRFADKPAIALVTSGEGTRSARFFDESGRQQLGSEQYDIEAPGGKADKIGVQVVYAAPYPEMPADAKPRAAFTVAGKGVRTANGSSEPVDFEKAYESHYVFVGFENLELKPSGNVRVFENACHLQSRGKDDVVDYWYVPQYGLLKMQLKNMHGQLLFNYSLESLDER